MQIKRDDLTDPQVVRFVEQHLQDMFLHSPPESVHALDVVSLRKPDVTFWSAWEADELVGCGALKELDPHHGEVKSMRTSALHLRSGVARRVLQHLIDEAQQRGYRKLSLETGSESVFEPARRLYARFGFRECRPFADYIVDPNSVYMTMDL